MSVSNEQNAAQRLSSEHKSFPIGCKENIEHKKTPVAVMLEILSIY